MVGGEPRRWRVHFSRQAARCAAWEVVAGGGTTGRQQCHSCCRKGTSEGGLGHSGLAGLLRCWAGRNYWARFHLGEKKRRQHTARKIWAENGIRISGCRNELGTLRT
jgi:hypothetical protein